MKDRGQNKQKNQLLDPILATKFSVLGFKELKEIQKKAIPIILQKKDSLIIAPTGTGKTECSVIPIFTLLKESKKIGKIKVLYITPLRALNRDVFRRITGYAKNDGLTIEIRHGDTSQKLRRQITKSQIGRAHV